MHYDIHSWMPVIVIKTRLLLCWYLAHNTTNGENKITIHLVVESRCKHNILCSTGVAHSRLNIVVSLVSVKQPSVHGIAWAAACSVSMPQRMMVLQRRIGCGDRPSCFPLSQLPGGLFSLKSHSIAQMFSFRRPDVGILLLGCRRAALAQGHLNVADSGS